MKLMLQGKNIQNIWSDCTSLDLFPFTTSGMPVVHQKRLRFT